jgi:co-chaperonin GroES (HSP10)
MQPLRDDIMIYAVSRSNIETKTGMIHIPEDTHKEENQWFKVFAVGPKVRDLKVGDVCLIPWKRITPPQYMEVDGENRQIGVTSEMEVLAVLEN